MSNIHSLTAGLIPSVLAAPAMAASVIGLSGVATKVSQLATRLAYGVTATVNFNPAADKLRVMGSDGKSLRFTLETGGLPMTAIPVPTARSRMRSPEPIPIPWQVPKRPGSSPSTERRADLCFRIRQTKAN